MTARALLLAGLFALTACGADRAPPAPPPRPALERPVLVLAIAGPVRIPRAALIERAGVPGVFVLAGGEARFRMVRPGKARGAEIEILAGLHGNETLVLGDLTPVRDGSPIRPN